MMLVKEVMTPNPACCTPDSTLQRAAELMVEHDCGEIPVIQSIEGKVPVGVITDRDITCRTVAKGLNPLTMTVGDCMTTPCITTTPDTPVEECCRTMEERKVRRLPVVDESGACCGIVALADIATRTSNNDAGEVVKEVSEPTRSSSAVG